MTPDGYQRMLEYLEDLFPDTKAYRSAGKLFHEFAAIPDQVGERAARDLVAEGRRMAPTVSELIATASRLLRDMPDSRDPYLSDCEALNEEHTWGILEEDPIGRRLGHCAKCGTQRWHAPGKLLTKSELIDRNTAHDPREERIAP